MDWYTRSAKIRLSSISKMRLSLNNRETCAQWIRGRPLLMVKFWARGGYSGLQGDSTMERSPKDKKFDINSFILLWLLKEIQGPAEVKLYHLYFENVSEFWKTEKHLFYQFDRYPFWLRNSGLLTQRTSRALRHASVQINEILTNKHH